MTPTINLGRKKPRDRNISTQRHQEIYNTPRWVRLRDERRHRNPLCQECEKVGRVTQVQAVHHIIPFETASTPDERDRLAFDYDNTESVCYECHDKLDRQFKTKKYEKFRRK